MVAVVTVIFWMSLYAANKSWAKMIGLALTLLVYLGGFTILVDRYLASSTESIDKLGQGRRAVPAASNEARFRI